MPQPDTSPSAAGTQSRAAGLDTGHRAGLYPEGVRAAGIYRHGLLIPAWQWCSTAAAHGLIILGAEQLLSAGAFNEQLAPQVSPAERRCSVAASLASLQLSLETVTSALLWPVAALMVVSSRSLTSPKAW